MSFETQSPRRALIQQLESWQQAGVTHVKKPSPSAARAPSKPSAVVEKAAAPAKPASVPNICSPASLSAADKLSASPLSLEQKLAGLDIIREEVVACTRCPHLAGTRTQTVFGVGNANTRLCFVGEAPGADEDAQGVPFVGRAGQKLNDIIRACTLKREEVYILNVLKCRPPGNRTPEEDEIANCRGFLDRQLEIIRPEFICCLGAVAAQAILSSTLSIGRLRGNFHDYRGIPVVCTYHPSYLLRNPAARRDVWEDMKMLMQRMGIDVNAGK